jgi:hypothetical protein
MSDPLAYNFDDFYDETDYNPKPARQHRRRTAPSKADVAWVEEGKTIRVENRVYDLTQACHYHYEPARLTPENIRDVLTAVVICYRFPVPGAKRYFVNPRSTEGTLQPLNTQQQLQAVPADQVVWVVNLTEDKGKAARKLIRAYLKSIEAE